jgi:hypothetical protein
MLSAAQSDAIAEIEERSERFVVLIDVGCRLLLTRT